MAEPQSNPTQEQVVETIERWFPPQWFARFRSEKGWSTQKLFGMDVLINWVAGHTLTERFATARELLKQLKPRWHVPSSLSGFTAARLRIEPLLFETAAKTMRQQTLALKLEPVLGWLLFAVDGSRFECPRTKDNERVLGCAGKEHTTPQLFQTTLWHLASELPWDVRIGPGTDSEQCHVRDMLGTLPAGSLLTADAGFVSFELLTELVHREVSFVIRVGGNRTLLTELGVAHEVAGETVYLWPQQHQDQPPLVLRMIVIQDGKTPVNLLTNVLTESRLSAADAAQIYRLRWGGEVYYRTVKRTFPFAKLCSRSPYNALTEQRAMLLSLWVLQLSCVAARQDEKLSPRRGSGAGARTIIRSWLRAVLLSKPRKSMPTLREEFATAVTDSYRRTGPKSRRHWPRKKSDSPPKPPKQRLASESERQRAKGFSLHCPLKL